MVIKESMIKKQCIHVHPIRYPSIQELHLQ